MSIRATFLLIADLDRVDWLWVCFGLAIAAVAWAAGRLVDRDPPPESEPSEAEPALAKAGNPLRRGATART